MVDACALRGCARITSWRKVPSQANSAGGWVDLAMAAGNPVPFYYASSPLVSAAPSQEDGIWHGNNVSPSSKHLAKMCALSTSANAVPLVGILCDYLLYYPFIDMDSTDEQTLTNSVSLPRYADGAGVQAFLVAQGSYVGGQAFTINYTNQSGVAGRVSQSVVTNNSTFTSTLVNAGIAAVANGRGPFIPLQDGDTGIRSVQSITFLAPNGGIAALVLCVPLVNFNLRAITSPSEICYLSDRPELARVYDGACVNMIAMAPTGSLSGVPIFGELTFIWN